MYFKEISAFAKAYKVPLIVNNKVVAPVLRNPIKCDRDMVAHSRNKNINDKEPEIKRVIIVKRNCDSLNGEFPKFIEPLLGYQDP